MRQVRVRDLSIKEINHSHLIKIVPWQPTSQECLARPLAGLRVYDPSAKGFNGGHGIPLPMCPIHHDRQPHAQHGHDQEQRQQRELRPPPLWLDQGNELGKELGHATSISRRRAPGKGAATGGTSNCRRWLAWVRERRSRASPPMPAGSLLFNRRVKRGVFDSLQQFGAVLEIGATAPGLGQERIAAPDGRGLCLTR